MARGRGMRTKGVGITSVRGIVVEGRELGGCERVGKEGPR